jgi:peptidoglycan/LPS O-acetylase OafA/YrhL
VLFALAYALIGTRYVYLIAPLYFLLTIVATAAFYRGVEVPTMNLGRELARRMRKTRPVVQEAPAPTTVAS